MNIRRAGNWFIMFTGYILIIQKNIWKIVEAQKVFVEYMNVQISASTTNDRLQHFLIKIPKTENSIGLVTIQQNAPLLGGCLVPGTQRLLTSHLVIHHLWRWDPSRTLPAEIMASRETLEKGKCSTQTFVRSCYNYLWRLQRRPWTRQALQSLKKKKKSIGELEGTSPGLPNDHLFFSFNPHDNLLR